VIAWYSVSLTVLQAVIRVCLKRVHYFQRWVHNSRWNCLIHTKTDFIYHVNDTKWTILENSPRTIASAHVHFMLIYWSARALLGMTMNEQRSCQVLSVRVPTVMEWYGLVISGYPYTAAIQQETTVDCTLFPMWLKSHHSSKPGLWVVQKGFIFAIITPSWK
jgi:hypothetical protein